MQSLPENFGNSEPFSIIPVEQLEESMDSIEKPQISTSDSTFFDDGDMKALASEIKKQAANGVGNKYPRKKAAPKGKVAKKQPKASPRKAARKTSEKVKRKAGKGRLQKEAEDYPDLTSDSEYSESEDEEQATSSESESSDSSESATEDDMARRYKKRRTVARRPKRTTRGVEKKRKREFVGIF